MQKLNVSINFKSIVTTNDLLNNQHICKSFVKKTTYFPNAESHLHMANLQYKIPLVPKDYIQMQSNKHKEMAHANVLQLKGDNAIETKKIGKPSNGLYD